VRQLPSLCFCNSLNMRAAASARACFSSHTQVDISEASYPMPVMADVATVSPNAAEIAWKFVPDLSTLGGRGVCVVHVTEHPPSPSVSSSLNISAPPPTTPPYSACMTAASSPFWIDGLSPSTRYSVRVGAKPAPLQGKVTDANGVLSDSKCEDADSSSVWAWSSPVEFTTASASE
jgi:hypothetical protein